MQTTTDAAWQARGTRQHHRRRRGDSPCRLTLTVATPQATDGPVGCSDEVSCSMVEGCALSLVVPNSSRFPVLWAPPSGSIPVGVTPDSRGVKCVCVLACVRVLGVRGRAPALALLCFTVRLSRTLRCTHARLESPPTYPSHRHISDLRCLGDLSRVERGSREVFVLLRECVKV